MRVSIIGSGVVGKATGLSLLAQGNDVMFCDINPTVLSELPKVVKTTTTLSEAYHHGNVLFICVPTPLNDCGECDTSTFEMVVRSIGALHKTHPHDQKVIVQKSTCVPGTADRMVGLLDTEFSRSDSARLDYVVCPEFLNAGTPVSDAMSPRVLVLGVNKLNQGLGQRMLETLYSYLPSTRIRVVNYSTAEYAKYANNIFHALLISAWNEFYIMAEKHQSVTGSWIDTTALAEITAMQKGLEGVYRVFGQAWGGACLPKDTQAFLSYAEQLGYSAVILDALIVVNDFMAKTHGVRGTHWKELHRE